MAHGLLARAIVLVGDPDEAEMQARRAVELDPLSAATHFSLGRVLFHAGKLDEAAAVGRKSAELHQPLLPVIDGRRWSLCFAAMAKRPYAKRNWSLTTAFVVSNSHSRTMYVASMRLLTLLWPTSSRMPRRFGLSNRRGLRPAT